MFDRITPFRVKRAYAATNIPPTRDTWAARRNGICEVCPAGVVIIYEHDLTTDALFLCADDREFADLLKIPLEYLEGFIDGIDERDGNEVDYENDHNYRMGFDDGTVVFKEVFGDGD